MKRRICFLLAIIAVTAVIANASILTGTGKPNIIIITLDTTRADHLGLYGYKKDTSPNIDRIAKDCAVFEQAITPVPFTLPSHVSIFTGTYPAYHNILHNGLFQLSPESATLAKILKNNGYQTAAFVASYVLHHHFGLNQGFDVYNDDFSSGSSAGVSSDERDAKAMTDAVIKWLRSGFKQPLFLWVHYYDPHALYNPPAQYAKKMGDGYDGEISYMDEQIGKLMNYLQSQKPYTSKHKSIISPAGFQKRNLSSKEFLKSEKKHWAKTMLMSQSASIILPRFIMIPAGSRKLSHYSNVL